MGHPFAGHRQTAKEHSRVGHITKKYAKGGAVHADEAEDKKLIKKMMKKELHADGEKTKHRMDRPKRAKGGKVHKGGKTVVNVITGHPGGAAPPMPGPPMGVAPAAMPPAPPPMAARPPMPPPSAMAGPGAPPPMPMRAKGGRIKKADGGPTSDRPLPTTKDLDDILKSNPNLYGALGGYQAKIPRPKAKGGRIHRADGGELPNPFDDSGPSTPLPPSPFDSLGKIKKIKVPRKPVTLPPNQYARGGGVKSIGMNVGTKVQHSPGKDDAKDIGRGRVVTFWAGGGVKKKCDGGPTQAPTRAMGGRTESPQGVAKATRLPGGSGGGEARLAKEHRAERR